ncbi:Crp/Fnr family transcriptional regulator [Lacinutrix neustonica]|uniref:Crp/Fnr family transcriptional regulator n=1 Tax=Lacinutrix neustonica TaxID=2980107 RepID=A0A9E8MX08_9FLAO|nr:Crp/Fnr family transcriptional regulator [Lacinutrix neustonica]WAC02454.1 Crp/Fnr family transcriptional regulator [Lacinutrix neustonica]
MYPSITKHIRDHIHTTAPAIHLFNSVLNEISVKKGAFLLKPGTFVKHEYFVVKGCLKAYYIDNKGHRHIIQFAVENWWIGDFDAFYNQGSSNIYIEAIEDAQLLSINYNSLQKIYAEAPVFERYFRILITSAFIAQRKRILSAQEKNTQERYLEFCNSYPNIEDRVPNYDIANYLGVTPENLSRVRKKLNLS